MFLIVVERRIGMLFKKKNHLKTGCISAGLIICGTIGFNIGKFSG